jgi:hypothetical protein
MFEVDAVGFEVSCERAVVAYPLIIHGGICITVRVPSASACFGGIIVHFAVYECVFLARGSSSTWVYATLSDMAMATISDTGV